MNRNINPNEQGFLGKKLEAAQWPVDPAVWQAVSAQVSTSAAAGGTAVASGGLAKIALLIGATAIAVASVVAVVRKSKPAEASLNPPAIEQPKGEEITAPTEEPSAHQAAQSTLSDAPDVNSEAGRAEAPSETAAQPSASAPKTPATEVNRALFAEDAPVESPSTQATKMPASEANEANQASTITKSPQNQPFTVDFDVVFDEYDELEVQFNAVLPPNANCEWDFGDGNRAAGGSPSHRFSAEGTYLVTLFANDGDRRRAQFEAEVGVFKTPKLILPNIFTPNNDGRNDVLTVAPESQNITVDRMVVMNGTGSLVYEAIGANAGWDGTLPSGDPAPAGSYRLIVSAIASTGERIHESSVVRLER